VTVTDHSPIILPNKSVGYDCLWTNSRRQSEYFVAREQERLAGRPSGLWIGYPAFDFPAIALEMYGGTTPLRILLRIYAHASSKAMRVSPNTGITLRTRISKHAGELKISRRSVSEAFRQLEQDGFIERLEQGRSEHHDSAGDFRSARIALTYPGDKWPLRAVPVEERDKFRPLRAVSVEERDKFGFPQGLLTANDYLGDIIIVPYAFMKRLNKLPDACSRAALLGALRECTDAGNESVILSPEQWCERSHLSRTDLFRGKRTLIDRKLVSYKRGILTMHDPKTQEPNARWQRRHTDKGWTPEQTERYEYVTSRTPEQILQVLLAAFPDIGLREVEAKPYKWIKEKKCPFCFAPTLFVHLHKRIFRCVGCNRRGHIFKQLIGQGLRQSFREVVEFSKRVLQSEQQDSIPMEKAA